ncbi:MAG TPA: TetR/AcrR family transcriptional regulator [Leptospiraceae bacterium]|nr:TetR/AcrR family transcriptional regulator [Leptospiraceae bacterium]HMW08453.1 TetR/AcrR family transcriptional regulator [Leptospiraceae bacterium]HMX33887.1 TetR/AcrR family transcriptional regulator [Leptospiraceae bacterium]HMY34200.1 TetR/AcrR family transcriptional regulator [Leptospiraceae bacterium]HMZ66418.1 TetR/AcrR family transcriptional regulator [Leptospiraceae bacterium]
MKKRSIGRPEKNILNQDKIITAALDLIDKNGVSNLSMRELAKNLKVDPMAIYHYLPNKESLLHEIVIYIFQSLDTSLQYPNNWKKQVKFLLNNYRNLVKKHPNLIYFILTEPAYSTKPSLELNEKLFYFVSLSNLSKQKSILLGNLLVDYLHGFSLAENTMTGEIEPFSIEENGDYPHFAEAINFNLNKKDSLFETTIDFILSSFE